MAPRDSLKRSGRGLAATALAAAIIAASAPAAADGMVSAPARTKARPAADKAVAPVHDWHAPGTPFAGGSSYGYYPYGYHYSPAPA